MGHRLLRGKTFVRLAARGGFGAWLAAMLGFARVARVVAFGGALLFGAALAVAALLGIAASTPARAAAPPSQGQTQAQTRPAQGSDQGSTQGSALRGKARTAAARPRDPLSVDVNDAWISALPAGTGVATAYFTLSNLGADPVVFVGVSCPIAKRATLHGPAPTESDSPTSIVKRIEIRPTQVIALMPTGLHVTLEGMQQPLVVGEQVPLVLHFAGGGQVRILAQVRPGEGE